MTRGTCFALCSVATLLGACGGSMNNNNGSGSCNPGGTAAITIKSSGMTPMNVCVLPSGTVTFTNSDTAPHDMVSDATCPELNTGSIAPSTTATVTFANTTKVCSFHDSLNPSNTAFQGFVNVTTAPVGGPGY
jgi:plastocyanin